MPHCPDKDHATICHDCLPSYQLAMKRQGRCANPNATFKFDQDGAIVGSGRRGHSDETRAKMRAAALARWHRKREDGCVVGLATP